MKDIKDIYQKIVETEAKEISILEDSLGSHVFPKVTRILHIALNPLKIKAAVQQYIKSKKQGDAHALIHTANMFNISALELQDVIQYLKVESVKESIIDIPRKNYAKDVFDDHDKENPKVKDKIKKIVTKQIKLFNDKFAPVVKYGLIGSILTKRYREDADLDINILFDVSEDKREETLEKLRKSLKDYNGKNVPGTKHPVNYYVIVDPDVWKKANKMADGVFNIEKDKWIKKPKDSGFDSKLYLKDFQKKVKEIDVVRGELKRDLIDYKELKKLDKDEVDDLSGKVDNKLKEVEDSVKTIIKIGSDVADERAKAFEKDMKPDEIRKFGVKNKLPKNVIYKMLEKYYYLKLKKDLKDVLGDDEKLQPDEVGNIKEAVGKHIAFTFGRFNPPTIGHQKLIDKLARVPADDYKVFVSKSEDPKRNPLPYNIKIAYMKKMFPRHSDKISQASNIRNAFDILVELYRQNVDEITMVVGSDRTREFDLLLNKYNDVKSRHGYYKFTKINIVSAGQRDPDEEGATGMSSSKMRDAALKKDLKSFKLGLPRTLTDRDAQALFQMVRKGMALAATNNPVTRLDGPAFGMKPIASMEEYEKAEARDDYIRENLYNVGDYVENIKTNAQGVIVRRGTNYIVIEDVNDKLHKSWIYDVIPMQGVISDELQEKRKKFKESYDIGHDYAKHTEKMTPGEPGYDPNYSGTTYVPSEKKKNLKQRVTRKMIDGIQDKNILQVSRKDIKEWANKTTTKDKYEARYKKDWKEKLQEDLKTMVKQSKTFKKLVSEVSPPGWKGTVKALKKKKEVDNPFALAWHMKNKGFKAHYKDSEGKPTKKAKYKDESLKEQDYDIFKRISPWQKGHKVINNYVYVTKAGPSKYEVWPESKPGDPVYNKVRHIGVHSFSSKVAAMVYARKLKKDYGIEAVYDNLNKKFLYNDYLTEYKKKSFKEHMRGKNA